MNRTLCPTLFEKPGRIMPANANISKRSFLSLLAGAGCLPLIGNAVQASSSPLAFDELYARIGVLGLEFSEKVKALNNRQVQMRGFMAPPLKAEAMFFVLTKIPMALCPFCSSDADWPEDIVVVYLDHRQTFVQYNSTILVEGRLEYGSRTDPETGFVSLLRLVGARFEAI